MPFCCRLRLPGGRLEGFQLAGLAGITQECAGGHLLFNPQGGLDVPGVPVRAAAEILRRTEGIGLSARQTGGDCVHAIRGGEDEGLMTDHPRALVYPLVCALEQALMHQRALADLPRGCEIVFQGADESSATGQAWDTDTIFLRTVTTPQFLPDGVAVTSHPPAFLLAVPGGLEGGFLLSPSRAVPGCLKLLEAWAAGRRTSTRWSTRRIGGVLCRALGSEKIRGLLESAPWQPDLTQSRTETLVTSGKLTPGFVIPEGPALKWSVAVSISKIARDHGLADIRLFRGCLHTVQAIDDAARSRNQLSVGFRVNWPACNAGFADDFPCVQEVMQGFVLR